MDYLQLLYAAAVRDFAKTRLNGSVPRELDYDDQQRWKQDRLDESIIAAAQEFERVAALIEQHKQAR